MHYANKSLVELSNEGTIKIK